MSGPSLTVAQLEVGVVDLRRTEDFWADVLQVADLRRTAGGLQGVLADLPVHAVVVAGDPVRHVRSVPEFSSNPPGYDHVVIEVPDIDAGCAHLRAHAVTIEVEAELALPEGGVARVARFTGPDGNLYGLQQRVGPGHPRPSRRRVDNLGIAVRDIARARAFWGDVLGVRMEEGPDAAPFFVGSLAGRRLVAFQTTHGAGPVSAGSSVDQLLGPRRLVLHAGDLDPVRRHLRHHGIDIAGGDLLDLADPDGNAVRILANAMPA